MKWSVIIKKTIVIHWKQNLKWDTKLCITFKEMKQLQKKKNKNNFKRHSIC